MTAPILHPTRRRLLGMTLAGLAPGLRAASFESRLQAAHDIIQAQVDAGVLSAAVLHARRGGLTVERGFGSAADSNAVFLLASITKPLVTTALLQLAQRGEVKLDDRAAKYLPEFTGGRRGEITLRHLCAHSSGLPDQLPENDQLRARHAPLGEFVRHAVRTPLLFAPGERYHYQSMGILLVAEIVERVTGEPLPEWLRREQFAPLGMTRTALGLGQFKLEETMAAQTEHAAPESGAGDPGAKNWDWNSPYWRNLAAPWGGAHGTAGDVARFLESFLPERSGVLKEQTRKEAVSNQTEGLGAQRGIGLALGPDGFGRGVSARAFGHTGSTGNLAWTDPATDTTCVILTTLPRRVSGDLILLPVAEVVAAPD
jgi:CubicO group peptidase (beta-lactamase class C family)